ncbi:MAG: choice-of-anchor D domain-containing protein [Ilumatobacteraceae bacterium]
MAVTSSSNRWWQNWPKNHAYVAQRMFHPRSAGEISESIREAERRGLPVRAVGGGWSFSDASLPGSVTTNRPGVHGVEALSAAVPHATTFPASSAGAVVASIAADPTPVDTAGSMIMIDDPGGIETQIDLWSYLGGGKWTYGQWEYDNDPDFPSVVAGKKVRPIGAPMGKCIVESDVAGSLVMFDFTVLPPGPSRDWFYNGGGVWSVGVAGDSTFDQGTLFQLAAHHRVDPAAMLSPRPARQGESVPLLLSRHGNVPQVGEPVALINTRWMASSLQQDLPSILCGTAADATSANPSTGSAQRHLFHVEAGITISELGELLAHQNPRLSLLAISGSPGASLAGALASATHGAEFNWPLLIDTVKAVHLVGPGGQQWWIEGDEAIADPVALRRAYPAISFERTITAAAATGGICGQDWLNAAIVSMGSMGVVYSVVIEVVPQFGVHEAVVQTTWNDIGTTINTAMPDPTSPTSSFDARLRSATAATATLASKRLLGFLLDGSMNMTGIDEHDAQKRPVNRYCDLAINPNRRPDGDFDCWIGNREVTTQVPLDPMPVPTNEMGAMIKGISTAFATPALQQKLRGLYSLGSLWDAVWSGAGTVTKLARLVNASDLIDVALDTFLTPMIDQPDGPEVAQALLSGLLAGLLGTANCDLRSDKTGVSVGALGFPASGVMGTGLEIALAPADAFSFLATEILDKIDPSRPFLGYVSIRICSQTKTLMGMQQFGDATQPYSVMIEIVAYASDNSKRFIHDLQQRTADKISKGFDAMLHWGLEQDLITGAHLRATPALQQRTSSGLSKLDTFKAVRALLNAGAPTSRVFDNAFTDRLWLSAETIDDDPVSFQKVAIHTRRTVTVACRNSGSGPMRIVGVSATGDFRLEPELGAQPQPRNLEVGLIQAAPTVAGDFFELPITFIAERPGTHLGTLTVITNADIPDSVRVITVALHAEVEGFEITLVQPLPTAVLDLGSIAVGTYSTTPITVHSNCTMNAWLDSCECSDPALSSQIGIALTGVGPMAPGSNATYGLSFEPKAVGPVACTVTLTFSDRVAPLKFSQQLSILVTAIGTGVQAQLSPDVIDFGDQPVGTTSAPQPATLTNSGQLPLDITSALIGSDFALVAPRPSTLAAGQSVPIDIVFRPGQVGPALSSFTVVSNSATPPTPVALQGNGLAVAVLTARPASLEFAKTPVGATFSSPLIAVRNDGSLVVTASAISVVGSEASDFVIRRSTIKAGIMMGPEFVGVVNVLFTPTAVGRRRANIEITHDGVSSPLLISVAGLATERVGLIAARGDVDFGALAVGTTATGRAVVTNTERQSLVITDVSITGDAADEFSLVTRSRSRDTIDPGTSLTYQISASPKVSGERRAELTVASREFVAVIALRSTGVVASVEWSAPMLDFSEVQVGATSLRRDIFVRNSGNSDLAIIGVEAVGDFAVQDLGPQYPTIAAGATKMFWVWFKPTGAGPRIGSLRLSAEGTTSVFEVALTGIGF